MSRPPRIATNALVWRELGRAVLRSSGTHGHARGLAVHLLRQADRSRRSRLRDASRSFRQGVKPWSQSPQLLPRKSSPPHLRVRAMPRTIAQSARTGLSLRHARRRVQLLPDMASMIQLTSPAPSDARRFAAIRCVAFVTHCFRGPRKVDEASVTSGSSRLPCGHRRALESTPTKKDVSSRAQ